MTGRRSWLFVPGDSERKLAKGPSTGADILILDVEDSVSPARKPVARKMIAEYLGSAARDGAPLWVRINGLHTPYWREDVQAATAAAPTACACQAALAGRCFCRGGVEWTSSRFVGRGEPARSWPHGEAPRLMRCMNTVGFPADAP